MRAAALTSIAATDAFTAFLATGDLPLGNSRRGSAPRPWGRPSGRCGPSRETAPGCEGYGYETASGRAYFLNRDPIEEAGGINLYGFCGNDSVNGIDVLGNSWFSKLWDDTFLKVGRAVGKAWDQVRPYIGAVVAIAAAVVTYGALSGWAAAEVGATLGVAATSTAATVGGGIIAGAAAGFVGGAVGTALSGGSFGQVISSGLRGAAGGAILGGVGGFYGTSYPIDRIPVTAVAGGLASEAEGGSFSRGFEVSGVISAATWTALWMRNAMIENSDADPRGYNASGESDGFDGDGYKLGGGRFDPDYITPDALGQVSPLGGAQGGQGSLWGIGSYAPGSFWDHLVETFAGPHDWLNSWWGYATTNGTAANDVAYYIGDYVPSVSEFGQYLGRYAGDVANIMNVVDVPLAAPLAAASTVGLQPGALGVVSDPRN